MSSHNKLSGESPPSSDYIYLSRHSREPVGPQPLGIFSPSWMWWRMIMVFTRSWEDVVLPSLMVSQDCMPQDDLGIYNPGKVVLFNDVKGEKIKLCKFAIFFSKKKKMRYARTFSNLDFGERNVFFVFFFFNFWFLQNFHIWSSSQKDKHSKLHARGLLN